jgi:hypothetical protein
MLHRFLVKHFLFAENNFSLFNLDRSFILFLLLHKSKILNNQRGDDFFMADDNKCDHENCSCSVGEDEDYCSPQCEAAHSDGLTAIKCDCGHNGCAGEV